MKPQEFVRKAGSHIVWRLNQVGALNRMPDEKYLQMMFYLELGKHLDLENPKSFNEKLQWLKLNDRKDIYTKLVDKYEVKRYIADALGEEYIIPTIGVWDRFEDIDFQQLPEKFVLKCTHDSGGLVICRDKSRLDIEKAKLKLTSSLKKNYYYHGREWPYKNVKPRIIAEPYMADCENEGLTDYKFYCFNGVVRYLYVSKGMENHKTAQIGFLTPEWELAPFGRTDYNMLDELPPKPSFYQEMLKIAEKLSEGMRFARVDLYEISRHVYFSEFTLHPCSGFMPFKPEEYDRILGELLRL